MKPTSYSASYFGDEKMMQKFELQLDDARQHFTQWIKPRLDRSYKIYVAYNGDRAREIKQWQANVFVPYAHGVVETLMPRILDARPEFTAMARKEEHQEKTIKLQQTIDYTWEIANMDRTSEDVTRSSLVYGMGYLQTSWRKEERTHKFLSTKNLGKPKRGKKKLDFKEEARVYYDAPYAEWVDNYALWYDSHNINRLSKQFWFKRILMTGAEIRRKYNLADPDRLELALCSGGGDLTDYASVRRMVKLNHTSVVRGADYPGTSLAAGVGEDVYQTTSDYDLRMHEVFEWTRPFDDKYAVMVNKVPIIVGGEVPMLYDVKETPFIDVPFLRLPGEFEGVGLPMILENPQTMLNMIKNQRLDAVTLNIHKMWIVNPMANIDKRELVTRPFGIIYSQDPNGVREVQFSDVKPSAYQEEDLLKSDMRYAAGVDDSSMGVGGAAGSATEVRHLRESTLERVRLFVNHLGDAYSILMRHWLDLYRQFMTEKMYVRIVGETGEVTYPPVEPYDLKGEFDYKAAVLPSIAGKADMDRKQAMDLFQVLAPLPFVDQRKLTAKLLASWGWSIDSVTQQQDQQPGQGQPPMMGPDGQPVQPMVGPDGQPMPPMLGPDGQPMMPGMAGGEEPNPFLVRGGVGPLPKLPVPQGFNAASTFGQAGMPINLLQGGGLPPTVKGAGSTTNPRGMNMGGKANTNIPINTSYDGGMKSLLNRSQNLQR